MRPCKNNMASLRSKSETEVLIIPELYKEKAQLSVPAAYGGTGSLCKELKIGVTPFPSCLGMRTTTATAFSK